MTAPLRIGATTLDPAARKLAGPGGTVHLSAQPGRLLACLVERAGRVVPLADLVASLHDPYGRADVRPMQVHLCAVRRALRDAGAGAGIATIRGVGARLDASARPDAPEVEPRPRGMLSARAARLMAAHAEGVSTAEIAARFGLAHAASARGALSRARRVLREERP